MQVSHIFLYPIKSCRGISLNKAQIKPQGLTDYEQQKIYDRQFMLVDEKGKFITQRQYPQLATIKIEINNNNLYLSSEENNIGTFEVIPSNEGEQIKVDIWRDKTIAIDQGDEVANWFKQALKININCRLVQQSDAHIRAINPRYSIKRNQPVSFADGFPFLLLNTASIDDLNKRLSVKYPEDKIQIDIDRFRPNIVVETDEPFIEDKWKKIIIGDCRFAVVKPCSRCIITTTDQSTGHRNELKEPLLTLSNYRNTSEGIMFGQNAIAIDRSTINLGDIISIIDNL